MRLVTAAAVLVLAHAGHWIVSALFLAPLVVIVGAGPSRPAESGIARGGPTRRTRRNREPVGPVVR